MNEKINFIHPTAIIDNDAVVGNMTKIWHFCHVSDGAIIGKNCTLGQNVFIGKNVVIGNGCKIQNNVSIFTGVTIEDDVFIGPGVTFTNIKVPRAFINKKSEFVPTLVCDGVSIGAGSVIRCGIKIGMYSMIGAGSVVTRNVYDNTLVFGNPAREVGSITNSGEYISYHSEIKF